MRIGPNTRVTIQYTARLQSGAVAGSTEGREPLIFAVGRHEVMPGLERALVGLEPGDRREIQLRPEEAYGRRRDDAIRQIPLERFPERIQPAVGMRLRARGPKGKRFQFTVLAISKTHATLDFNHPLAGEHLTVNVYVVDVQRQRGDAAARAGQRPARGASE